MRDVQGLEKYERMWDRYHRLDANHEILVDYTYDSSGMVSRVPMRFFWKIPLLTNRITRNLYWELS